MLLQFTSRGEVIDEHPLVGPAGAPGAALRSVGRHEALPVRQDQRGCSLLRRAAAQGLDGARHPRARLHRRADRPQCLALAPEDHGGRRRGLGDREPRVHLGARPIPRGPAHLHERRAGPPHGIHRVRPACPEADLLTGGPPGGSRSCAPAILSLGTLASGRSHGLADVACSRTARLEPARGGSCAMTLAPHVRLGPYEVLDRIGAGGMGVVYRARDTRLEREVALKLLPDSFASDVDRLRRFEREAKVLAALNHPNVGQIYGLDRHGDTLYLALELVAGEDLAERVARGPAPIDEALDVCRQIAAGLEAAHEAGIVHRDLKPANVRVTPQGSVKVLDFGLAKPLKSGSDSALLSEAGLVLGTPTYMSPEQIRGKHVDRRTDLWALGCVLFECLSGRRAFEGTSTGDVLTAVLNGEPDWSLLPPSTPARARELVRRCLEKDPLRRLRDAGDARIELEDALAKREVATGRAASAAHPVRAGLVAGLALAGAALLLLGWLAGWWIAPRDSAAVADSPQPFHLSAMLSAESRFAGLVAIAPDASYLVYSSISPGHVEVDLPRGWLTTRWLDRDETRIIEGTEGATTAALPPDGRWPAFLALAEGRGIDSMRLMKVALEDGRAVGPPILLSPALEGWANLCYASDQEIVLTMSAPEGRFLSVPAQGGTPRVVVEETEEDRAATQRWAVAHALPGGRWVLANRLGIRDGRISRDIEAVDLTTGERKLVLERATAPHYAPTGHLLAVRDGALVAVPFDAERLELRGEVVALRDVGEGTHWGVPYAFSETGVLAVVPRSTGGRGRIAWLDPQGQTEALEGTARPYFWFRIAREGRRVAYGTWEPDQLEPPGEFWVQDLERRTTIRLPIPKLTVFDAIWDPNGETLTYGEGFDNNLVIRERRADGSSEPALLYSHAAKGGVLVPLAWTRDGSTLAFTHRDPGRDRAEIWMLQRGGAGAQSEATRYLTTQVFAPEAAFSPDGKWFCFTANDAGRQEIFVQRFGGVGSGAEDERAGRWKVSTDGGRSPWWSADGREIRFVDSQDRLVSVSVEAGSSLSILEARTELDLKGLGVRGGPTFTDEGRMLVALTDVESEEVTRIDVVLDWFEELKAKAPERKR